MEANGKAEPMKEFKAKVVFTNGAELLVDYLTAEGEREVLSLVDSSGLETVIPFQNVLFCLLNYQE